MKLFHLALASTLLLLLTTACGTSSSDDDVSVDSYTDALSDITTEDGASIDSATPDVEKDIPPIDWDAVFTKTPWDDDGKRRVVILHTNDLHSHLNGTGPLLDHTPEIINDDETRGGFARVGTVLERVRRDLRPGASSITLDGGDFTCGTAFGALSRLVGVELRVLDALGYDATTLGNHELDWTPSGTAAILENGLNEDSNIQVLASNLKFSDDAADDDLENLMGSKLHQSRVLELDNGLKIGIFGLIGEGAFKLSPKATPVEIESPSDAAQAMVDQLRNVDGVDLVVAVSHGGVSEGNVKGEDESIATKVNGIDVIISGHTHTLMLEPTTINGTVIVQAGCYSSHVGVLTMVEGDDGFALEGWETVPVDDSVPGLPEIIEMVAEYEAELDDELFQDTDHGYMVPVAHSDFDLNTQLLAESSIGNLIADAVRWAATGQFDDNPVAVAFEANGVIRDSLKAGETGKLAMGDAFRIVPLGLGHDGTVGYPILSLYLTATEIKVALEVVCGVAPAFSDMFYLQVSGLRFECDFEAGLFEMVTAVYLMDEDGEYSKTPLDVSASNTKLYHVATNLYIGEMLSVLKSMTGGLLAIEPKNAEGDIAEDLSTLIIPRKDGKGELKLWQALYEYLAHFEAGESGLPEVPESYKTPQGRSPVAPN